MLGCEKSKAVLNTLGPELFSENAPHDTNCCNFEGKPLEGSVGHLCTKQQGGKISVPQNRGLVRFSLTLGPSVFLLFIWLI